MKKLLLIATAITFTNILSAQEWDGSFSTLWSDTANWTGGVPTSASSVVINGASTPPNWPILNTDVTISSLTIINNGQLNTNGHSLTTLNNTDFNGAIISSSTGTSYFNFTNTGYVYIRNCTFQSNVDITVSDNRSLYEAYSGNNTFNSNLTIHANTSGVISLGESNNSSFNGNVSIYRAVAGSTELFKNGNSIITGNLLYDNTAGGYSKIGVNNPANKTKIGGSVTINLSLPTTAGYPAFDYYYTDNAQDLGGTILIKNTGLTNFKGDSIMASTITLDSIQGGYRIYENVLTAAISLSDHPNNTTWNGTGGNIINGAVSYTQNSAQAFYESYLGSNTYYGNVSCSVDSSGDFYLGYDHPIFVNGNLGVTRSSLGSTFIMYHGNANITGNLSYTNAVGGYSKIGVNNAANKNKIGGSININLPLSNTAGYPAFDYYYTDNAQDLGGNILIRNTGLTNFKGDSIMASTVTLDSIQGGYSINENVITAAVTLSDHPSNTTWNATGGNIINGAVSYTQNSAQAFYESYLGSNTYYGNVSCSVDSSGDFHLGHDHPIIVNGNLGVMRTSPGSTFIMYHGSANITGNLSYTNTVGGYSIIGVNNVANKNRIGGSVNINLPLPSTAGYPGFDYYYTDNAQALGGTILIKNTGLTNFKGDSIMASTITLDSIKGGYRIYENVLTADINLADHPSNTTWNGTGGNLFNGSVSYIHNSSQGLYESYLGSNNYYGDVSFQNLNSGAIYTNYTHSSKYGKGVNLQGANYVHHSTNPYIFHGNEDGVLEADAASVSFNNISIQKTNASSLLLNKPLQVNTNISFQNGYVLSSTSAPLIFNNSSTYSGASDSSFVKGTVSKIGNSAFTFPIGSESLYLPMSISAPASASDTFTASFITHNPTIDGYDTANRATTIEKISEGGYYDLSRNAASTSAVTVGISYRYAEGEITDTSALRIAHWNGSTWEDLGNGGVLGNFNSGSLITDSLVTSFSPFTLATTNSASNPLPIQMQELNAKVIGGKQVQVTWNMLLQDDVVYYEVEHSLDGKQFETIAKVEPKIGQVKYEAYHHNPTIGINYYRIKINSFTSELMYSKVVEALIHTGNDYAIYPNPTKGQLFITCDADYDTITIDDMSGHTIAKFNADKCKKMDIAHLPNGIYLLKISKGNNILHTTKFVKQ